MTDFITSLPLELSLYLLLFVEPQSICRAMQVSKGWNRLAGGKLSARVSTSTTLTALHRSTHLARAFLRQPGVASQP